ncbi:fumarylacetoacetate hydrolase family protein [Leucobacter komagatae]|uniref:Fumarylacetoacetate hydrolase n=1 Tax=Leucobacter komagatae TaxID=55969 RepID=A0A0D0HVD3_9MICO|nr:fumarylacetoacetate hydrolase family protein [Leucobacter komagatae]KIP51501.1 fumarylacetoacetate hydrolase [Leucobacter komagatae]
MSLSLTEAPNDVLPVDVASATLVGRVFVPEYGGPAIVTLDAGRLVDISSSFPTMADLTEQPDVLAALSGAERGRSWSLEQVLENSAVGNADAVHLLAPIDLAAVKAAGVTFAASLMERLIEERAGGDLSQAEKIRGEIESSIGAQLSGIIPGSPESVELKRVMASQGLWSQYLEVGLGPDPEVFTKAQPLSAVGFGQEIGVSRVSNWNNPEPEVVLVINSRGQIIGGTLGNDVNLRDVEGRSALLLPRAKDNNASASLGPFLRLFDEGFSIDEVRNAEVTVQVFGEDGFVLNEMSSMNQISRDVQVLASYACGDSHQYPDGLVLYTGTLFAPTKDRGAPGLGFTHEIGDVVRIASPKFGTLANRVNTSEQASPWTFGLRELIANLNSRGLTSRVGQ